MFLSSFTDGKYNSSHMPSLRTLRIAALHDSPIWARLLLRWLRSSFARLLLLLRSSFPSADPPFPQCTAI